MARKASSGKIKAGKARSKAKPVAKAALKKGPAILVAGKVMTLQQKQKEEERRLKEYICTRSYNQLVERSEDIAERLEELRNGVAGAPVGHGSGVGGDGPVRV